MSAEPGSSGAGPDNLGSEAWPRPKGSAEAGVGEPRRGRSGELDELFGEGDGAARPRHGLVLALLGGGLGLALVGMVCTPAVGGVLVLLGLYVAEKESARVDSGYLPVSERAGVRRLRGLAIGAVALVVALFGVQIVLMGFGVYNDLWMGTIGELAEWREEVFPRPDPPDPGAPAPGAPAPHPGAPAPGGPPHP
jgi:hypothetical protein